MLKEFIHNQDEAKIAILGTIFADGHLIKARHTSSKDRLSYINKTSMEITHTVKNLDYLRELKELIELIDSVKCSIKEHNKRGKEKSYTLFRLSTTSCQYFKEVRDVIYKEGIKTFPKEFIDKFSDLSLFLLYLDDGTLRMRFYEGTTKIREKRVTFCLDSFTYEELRYFQTFLKRKYNIDSHMYRHTKTLPINRGFRVWMNSENTVKFMTIIDKFYDCIPSMKYKFTKYYLS